MVLAWWCFGAMGFIMKLAFKYDPVLTGVDCMFIRSCLMWPIYYIIAKCLGVDLLDISPWQALVLIFRCLAGAIGMNLFFMSIKYLPTSIAFMVFNINPLFVSFFACCILSESVRYVNAFCCMLALSGVSLVAYGRKDENKFELFNLNAIVVCAGAALISSLAVTSMKKLNQSVHYIFSPYYLCLACIIVSLWLFCYEEDYLNIEKYDQWDWVLLVSAGLFSLIGQLLLSWALQYSNATSAAPLLYINWLFNVFADLFYFKLKFYLLDLAGAGVITVCVFIPVLVLCYEQGRG